MKRNWAVPVGFVGVVVQVALAVLLRGPWASSITSWSAVAAFALLAALGIAVGMLAVSLIDRVRSFGGTLGVALLVIGPVVGSGVLRRLPLVSELWTRNDPARHIISVISLVLVWQVLYLFTRVLRVVKERRLIRSVDAKLTGNEREVEWVTLLTGEHEAKQRTTHQRVSLIIEHKARPDLLAALAAERAASDAAAVQSAYGPVRALVWALPALGFIGTAATMSASISGIGLAIQGQAGSDEQQRALADVVPNLGHAFNITLIALAVTVVAFLLMAIVTEHEERMLNDVDGLALRLIGRIDTAWPPTPGVDRMDRLLTELWSLEREIAQLRGPIATFVKGDEAAFTLFQLLYQTHTELRALNQSALTQVRAMRDLSNAIRRRSPAFQDMTTPPSDGVIPVDKDQP